MSRAKDIPFSTTGSVFLDPEEVGSAIQYRVNVVDAETYVSFNASISLSDCARWITWDLESDEAEMKLDRAIQILSSAKLAVRAGRKAYDKAHARLEKRKAEEKK